MIGKPSWRNVRAGIEMISAGVNAPRHQHLGAYVTVVLAGRYEQVGYAGRLLAEPGDILLQPTLDCHRDRMISRGIRLLRIPWRREAGYGGIYRVGCIDELQRMWREDPDCVEKYLEDLFRSARPLSSTSDWEDLIARRLRESSARVSELAADLGLRREMISRGFTRAYGTSPSAYRCELRARAAWLKIVSGAERLCEVAVDTGFSDQPHMSRAIRELTGLTPAQWRRLSEPKLKAAA